MQEPTTYTKPQKKCLNQVDSPEIRNVFVSRHHVVCLKHLNCDSNNFFSTFRLSIQAVDFLSRYKIYFAVQCICLYIQMKDDIELLIRIFFINNGLNYD